jgi:hypothetical protein
MRWAETEAAESLQIDPTRDFARERDASIDLEITGTNRALLAATVAAFQGERERAARAVLAPAIEAGARLVVYQYCVSILILTFRRASGVKLIAPGQNPVLIGLPYTLVTLVAGWWGIPWGPIYTIQALWRNLNGGIDVTDAFGRAEV